LSPTPMFEKDDGNRNQSNCRIFTLWGKYSCKICRGVRFWTCM